nr:lipoprotein [Fredinandcohnia onubensis]
MKNIFLFILILFILAGCNNDKGEVLESDENVEPYTLKVEENWTDDFHGYHTSIQEVIITNEEEVESHNDTDYSLLGIKYEVTNTSTNLFETGMNKAVLLTNTGEQVQATVALSNVINQNLGQNEVQEGYIYWRLKNPNISEIDEIKLIWPIYLGTEAEHSEKKDYIIELNLDDESDKTT